MKDPFSTDTSAKHNDSVNFKASFQGNVKVKDITKCDLLYSEQKRQHHWLRLSVMKLGALEVDMFHAKVPQILFLSLFAQ